MVSVAVPLYQPAANSTRRQEAYQVAETEGQRVCVTEILQYPIAVIPTLGDDLEKNLNSVVNRRDPAEELDYRIGTLASICEAPSAKVKQHNAEIAN